MPTARDDDLIDLAEVLRNLWRNRLLISATTLLAAVISIVIALYMPNIYRADTLLSPASQDDATAIGGLASQFGGLASLAGIDIGSRSTDKATLAIEVLKSREFITSFINKHNLLIPLFAAKRWSNADNNWIIDETIFNTKSNQWVRDASPPRQPKPSDWEAYSAFSELFSISQDKKTGLIHLTIDSRSPQAAKQWCDWLVKDANDHIRLQDIDEANQAIEYLQKQIAETPVAEMQSIFYQLIEQQTKTVLLAKVRNEYAFKTIDAAVIPEEKFKPKRSLIVLASTLAGLLVGVSIALVRSGRSAFESGNA